MNNTEKLITLIGEPLLIVTFDYTIFDEIVICVIPAKHQEILKRLKYVVEYYKEFKVVVNYNITLNSIYEIYMLLLSQRIDKICIEPSDIPHHLEIVKRINSFVKPPENYINITDLNWYHIHSYMSECSEVNECYI